MIIKVGVLVCLHHFWASVHFACDVETYMLEKSWKNFGDMAFLFIFFEH
jgi:hypothetical protein